MDLIFFFFIIITIFILLWYLKNQDASIFLRASSGMMILIARVYVPRSFIHRKLPTSCLCKRKEKNNSFLNINVVSLSKKIDYVKTD